MTQRMVKEHVSDFLTRLSGCVKYSKLIVLHAPIESSFLKLTRSYIRKEAFVI